jgi:copper chaperone CopZ
MDENCYVEPVYKNLVPADQLQKADKATLIVSGMGCNNCATRVRNSLLSIDGVYGVDVFLNMAVAEIIYDREIISPREFALAVERAGNDGRHEYRAQLVAME